ncbi:hypothetical protein BGZ99_009030, partial [Dissophora globulifera]
MNHAAMYHSRSEECDDDQEDDSYDQELDGSYDKYGDDQVLQDQTHMYSEVPLQTIQEEQEGTPASTPTTDDRQGQLIVSKSMDTLHDVDLSKELQMMKERMVLLE